MNLLLSSVGSCMRAFVKPKKPLFVSNRVCLSDTSSFSCCNRVNRHFVLSVCSVEGIGIKSTLRLYHYCVFHNSFCSEDNSKVNSDIKDIVCIGMSLKQMMETLLQKVNDAHTKVDWSPSGLSAYGLFSSWSGNETFKGVYEFCLVAKHPSAELFQKYRDALHIIIEMFNIAVKNYHWGGKCGTYNRR